MLHTKFHGNWSTGFGDFLRIFIIYRRGSNLGHVTSIMLMIFHFLVHKSLHAKFGGKWLWFLRKACFNFHIFMTMGQGQEMTLTFNTHITSLTR